MLVAHLFKLRVNVMQIVETKASRESTSGILFISASGPIIWTSTTQPAVTLSPLESEVSRSALGIVAAKLL